MNVAALVRGFSLFRHLLICRKLKSHFKTYPPTQHPRSCTAAGTARLAAGCSLSCVMADAVKSADLTMK